MNRDRHFLVPLQEDKLQIIDTSKMKRQKKHKTLKPKSFAKTQYTHEERQDHNTHIKLHPVREATMLQEQEYRRSQYQQYRHDQQQFCY
jgi:hypothetical protein